MHARRLRYAAEHSTLERLLLQPHHGTPPQPPHLAARILRQTGLRGLSSDRLLPVRTTPSPNTCSRGRRTPATHTQ